MASYQDLNMAIRSMVLLMTIAVALGGRRGGFATSGSFSLQPLGNRAGNDEELGDSISLDTLDDAQDVSNTKATTKATAAAAGSSDNDAMCTQSTSSGSFPGVVGKLSCCGQTSNDPCPADETAKQTSHCRDDLSDGAFFTPRIDGETYNRRGHCLKFSKSSATAGMAYTAKYIEGGKTVKVTTKAKISTPHEAGNNVGVLGLKRVKCVETTEGQEDCKTFKIAVCLDCSSKVSSLRGRSVFVESDDERKFQEDDGERLYEHCVTSAFDNQGSIKPAFILNNNSGNDKVKNDALTKCENWIRAF